LFRPFLTIAFWKGAENWDEKQSLSIQRVIISCNYLIFFSIDFLKNKLFSKNIVLLFCIVFSIFHFILHMDL